MCVSSCKCVRVRSGICKVSDTASHSLKVLELLTPVIPTENSDETSDAGETLQAYFRSNHSWEMLPAAWTWWFIVRREISGRQRHSVPERLVSCIIPKPRILPKTTAGLVRSEASEWCKKQGATTTPAQPRTCGGFLSCNWCVCSGIRRLHPAI